jgi:hypothetical protein
MQRDMFDSFAPLLLRHGSAGVSLTDFVLGRDRRDTLRYVPFEYVNREARLVIVGITPGPTQLEESYSTAQRQLRAGAPKHQAMHEIKKVGAFGGDSMRPNLIRMLRLFSIGQFLRIDDEASLWGSNASLFHATSLIPHAAFRHGRPFAGSFRDIQKSAVFSECFRDCFLPEFTELGNQALFLGLGPTVADALAWCVSQGLLRAHQVLGAFPHPSRGSGSQVDYFLGKKSLADLNLNDPVRRRTAWLDAARQRLQDNLSRLRTNRHA